MLGSALEGVRGEWSVEKLTPLLDDRRGAGLEYSQLPDSNVLRNAIRVCDRAAEFLAKHNPRLHFELVGSHKNLDRQIHAMIEAPGGAE